VLPAGTECYVLCTDSIWGEEGLRVFAFLPSTSARTKGVEKTLSYFLASFSRGERHFIGFVKKMQNQVLPQNIPYRQQLQGFVGKLNDFG
jgi:hypothetical protein